MNINTKQALKNYYEDLRYMAEHWGRDSLNQNTCGTPVFVSDVEMNTYIDAIGSLITEETKKEIQ